MHVELKEKEINLILELMKLGIKYSTTDDAIDFYSYIKSIFQNGMKNNDEKSHRD